MGRKKLVQEWEGEISEEGGKQLWFWDSLWTESGLSAIIQGIELLYSTARKNTVWHNGRGGKNYNNFSSDMLTVCGTV